MNAFLPSDAPVAEPQCGGLFGGQEPVILPGDGVADGGAVGRNGQIRQVPPPHRMQPYPFGMREFQLQPAVLRAVQFFLFHH